MKIKLYIFEVFLIMLGLLVPLAGFSVLYKYVDDDGVPHYTNRPEEVPVKYRDRLEEVKAEISIIEKNPVQAFLEKFKRKEVNPEKWLVYDQGGTLVGFNARAFFINCLWQSGIIMALGAELLLLIIAVIIILIFRYFPTRKARTISIISAIIGYFLCSGLVFWLLIKPAYKKFFVIAREDLAKILANPNLEEGAKSTLGELDKKLEEYQNRVVK